MEKETTKEKLLDDEIFGEFRIKRMLGIPIHKPPEKDLHPLLDHYDAERNEKLGRKLFEP